MRWLLIAGMMLVLAGCGALGDLRPSSNKRLPIAPYSASATPTPRQLLTPTAQQRPQRNDELLTTAENRSADPFDLPPQN